VPAAIDKLQYKQWEKEGKKGWAWTGGQWSYDDIKVPSGPTTTKGKFYRPEEDPVLQQAGIFPGKQEPLKLLRWPEEWGEMPVSPWHRPSEVTPTQVGTQPQLYESPTGWGFTEDYSMFVSPEGEQFTLEEAQTQLAYMGFEGLVYDYDRNLFVPATTEGVEAREKFYRTAQAQLGQIGEPGFVAPPGTPGAISMEEYQTRISDYNALIAEQREALSSAFTTVFPGQSIDDFFEMVDSMVKTDDMSPDEIKAADELQAEFLETIAAAGRTHETEFLLRTVFPSATEEDINELFGEAPLEIQETPQAVMGLEPEWMNVRTHEVITESEKAKRYPKGYEAELDEWVLTPETARNYGSVFWVFGQALTKLPKQWGAAVLQAIQGKDGASVVDPDWADRFIADASTDAERFVTEVSQKYRATRLPIKLTDLAELPQSMAFSLTSMGAGLAVGVPTAFIPVPGARIAAWVAGTATSGAVAYNMSTYQIMQTYLEIKDEEMRATIGRGLTLDEENQLKADFSRQATAYGLWEAVPEALSNLAFGKILTMPLGKMVGKSIAIKIITKLGSIYGEELLTETVTQKGQSDIEVEAGLREERISWIEAFKEIFPQTFLLTTILGGLGQVGVSSVNKIKQSLKKEKGDSPIYEDIKDRITEDVFAEIEAEAVEMEKVKPEAIPPTAIPEVAPEIGIPMPVEYQQRILNQFGKGTPGFSTEPAGLIYRDPSGNPVAAVTLSPEADGVRVGSVVNVAKGILKGKATAAFLKELETIDNVIMPDPSEMSPEGFAIYEKFQKKVTAKPPVVEPRVVEPEVFITKEQWTDMSEQARRKALSESGLDPKLSSKSWASLSPYQQEVLKGEAPIIPEEQAIYREGGVPVNPNEPIPQGVVDNIPIIKDIGVKERWFRPSRKVFERMGLYEDYKGIQRAEVELGEANMAFGKKLKEVSKLVDKSRRHLIFRELENPGSQVGLTFNEKRAVNFFRENFNKWADTLNLPQEKRVKNYITHIFEADIEEQLRAKHPLDPAIARALEDRAPKTIFNPFLQERLGATVGLIEDPFAAALAYESRQLRVLYYQPFVQKIAAIANDPNTPQVFRDYLIDYSRRMTKEPSKLDKSINNTLQDFAGAIEKLPGGKPFANFLTRGNPSGLVAYQFTGVLYTLWLGFKPTSAIRNLSQHTLIIGEIGPVRFAEAVSKTLTAESKQAVAESLVMRSRKAAFVPGIDDSFVDKWTDEFREAALLMFRAADKVNVRHAFLGGYYEAKHLLPEADRQVWIDRGDEVAADTQYLYTQMNSMAISQSSAGRIFAVLTTWSQNWIELMSKWITRRPSQVYKQYEKKTGKKVTGANWSTSYKAILLYMVIVGLGYAIKEEERLKAWEYTGITSIRYLADVIGGDFPGLQGPGAIANMIAGFVTDDERMFKQGWYDFKATFTPGIVRQLERVVSGDKDWLTLFFYLEGKDFHIKKLKNKWEKGWREYDALEKAKDRTQYRKDNPLIEAQMFVTSKFTTLSSEEARQEVLRIIEENDLDTELIDGYEKVFGVDTNEEFDKFKKLLGEVELTEEGEQKLKENGELDYYTTSNFASDVNKLEGIVGRTKIEKDGNALAVEYLRAKDLFVQYESLTKADARNLYRQQFPDIEAQLFLWGKISTLKNPKSAEILLDLMDKYNIPPEAVPAFLDNPEKYDELFTQRFELQKKTYDLDMQYENFGNPESDSYIEDTEARKLAREKLKDDNPIWRADTRRIEAIDHDASPEMIEAWADRGKVIDKYGASSAQAKIWMVEHPEVHEWALREGLVNDDGSGWNEDLLRINIELARLDKNSDEYKRLNYKREAYQSDIPENLIDTYVDWYMTQRSGYEDDWFLMENQEFYQTMVDKGIWQERDFTKIPTREQAKTMDEFYELPDAGYDREWFLMENKEYYRDVWLGVLGNQPIDFKKIPTREVFDLYQVYQNLPLGSARMGYRIENPELDAWLVLSKGYKPATGTLTEEQSEKLSLDEEIAKRLSEMGDGGQILPVFRG